jgi:hypothetical protein
MRKILSVLAVAAVLPGALFAAGGDRSEAGVPTSPLKILSYGAGAAVMAATFDDAEEWGSAFGLSSNFLWRFMDNAALFADINWYYYENAKNAGAEIGMDYFFASSSVRPFAGAGIGAHYYGDPARPDRDYKLGPSVRAHVGVEVGMTETVALRVMAPFRFTMTKANDVSVGLEVGFLYSDKVSKVRKLNYQ